MGFNEHRNSLGHLVGLQIRSLLWSIITFCVERSFQIVLLLSLMFTVNPKRELNWFARETCLSSENFQGLLQSFPKWTLEPQNLRSTPTWLFSEVKVCYFPSFFFLLRQVSSHGKLVHTGLEKKEQLVLLKFSPLSSYFKMPHFRHCCGIVLTLRRTIFPSQISFQHSKKCCNIMVWRFCL